MKVGILGAGAYGIALASVVNNNNYHVEVWTPIEEEYKELTEKRIVKKLNNYELPQDIKINNNLEEVCTNNDLIIIAIPAKFLNETVKNIKKYINNQHICIATKGMENETCRFAHEIVTEEINTNRIAAISGPTFAIDMINKVTIGLSLGTENRETANLIKQILSNDYLKLRDTKDITGIEFCGSIKNVIAIAAGMIDGMELPESTKAMFITESLNDISKLLEIFGGNKKTIMSFAGFGDLLLTCTSPKSRNFIYGKLIGKKETKETIDNYKKNTTIEGLYTLDSIYNFSVNKNISMQIIEIIYNIIYNNQEPETLLKFLINK